MAEHKCSQHQAEACTLFIPSVHAARGPAESAKGNERAAMQALACMLFQSLSVYVVEWDLHLKLVILRLHLLGSLGPGHPWVCSSRGSGCEVHLGP